MSELSELYQEVILDHNKHPRNFCELPDCTNSADGYNPLCGDRVSVFVRLKDDRIEDISFLGNGCAISKASASMMTDALKGMHKNDAESLFRDVHEMLTGKSDGDLDADSLGKLIALSGVCEFPVRVKCATLAWHTMRNAIEGGKDQAKTE
jgi:nitrogen fixation NifU-like protein